MREWRDASPIHPVDERSCHLLRSLKRRQVPASGDLHKPRTADRDRNLARKLGRRRLVTIADKDERRAFDHAKAGARIWTTHDRLLLTQESLDPGLRGHRAYRLPQGGIVVAIAVNVKRKGDVRHFGITTVLGECDHHLAPLRLLGRLGARAGVE